MARLMTLPLWTYKVKSFRVIDGDTIETEIDLGFGVSVMQILRLARINAPEMSTAEGVAAKAFLEEQLAGKSIVVQTTRTAKDKRDKYGRYIAEVFTERNINDLMVATEHAVLYT